MKRNLQIVAGFMFAMVFMFAAQTMMAQTASAQRASAAHDIRYYVIVAGSTQSGSWDTERVPNVERLRSQYGNHFAWFRDGGREYVVTDSGMLDELDKAMEPQKKVNALQSDVNEDQSRVNGLQAKVNAHQNDVNAAQKEVNYRQNIANRLQSAVTNGNNAEIDKLQAELRDLRTRPDVSQSSVNEMQSKVNDEQDGVNAEQAKVNERQHGVNDEQHRVSAQVDARVSQILNDAVEHGTAHLMK